MGREKPICLQESTTLNSFKNAKRLTQRLDSFCTSIALHGNAYDILDFSPGNTFTLIKFVRQLQFHSN